MNLLDGLPLAIELAAARVRVMPPRTLLARMSERFKLLASERRPASTGRRRCAATFDWSWDLLPTAEKAALAQLSVFEGGFTLEAAEAVLDLSAYEDAPWPLDALQSLVDKSLVRQVGDERFDLLGERPGVRRRASAHARIDTRAADPGACERRSRATRRGSRGLAEQQATAGALRRTRQPRSSLSARRGARRCDRPRRGALEGAWAALQLRGPFKAAVDLAREVGSVSDLPDALRARVERIEGRALEAWGRVAEARARYESALAPRPGCRRPHVRRSLAEQPRQSRCERRRRWTPRRRISKPRFASQGKRAIACSSARFGTASAR